MSINQAAEPEESSARVTDPDFRRLFNAVPGAFAAMLPDEPVFTVVGASDGYVRQAGVGRDRLLGRGLLETWAAAIPSLRASLERVLATRRPDKIEQCMDRPPHLRAQNRHWNTVITPVLDERGRVQYILHSMEEVTDTVLAGQRERRAARELRTIETRFRQLAESATVGLAIGESNGRLFYLNPAARDLLGYTEQDVAAGLVRRERITPPEFRHLDEDAVRQVSTTGRCTPYEKALIAKDGRRIPVLVGASRLDAGSGRTDMAVFIVDLTDRKKAEQDRRLLSLVVENNPEFVGIADLNGTPVYANAGAMSLVGARDMDEVRAIKVADYFAPEDREFVETHVLPEALNKGSWRGELRLRHLRTNEAIPVFYHVFRVDNPDTGEPSHFAAITRDLRERKRAEQLLRTSDERLEQVFLQAPVAVAVLRGEEMRYEMVNPLYQAFFPHRKLVGLPILEAVPEVSDSIVGILRRVLATGEPFVGSEYHMLLDRDNDGLLKDAWFTFVYHPLRGFNGDTDAIIVIATDVTQHVQARRELERANRELEEFSYIASHDLQEPLRTVNTYTQLLTRRAMPEDQDAADYAAFIRQGVVRMEELIQDVLTYSRVVHAEDCIGQTADLSAALSKAVDILHTHIAETGASIASKDLPVVSADPAQMVQVFQNLISNSLKYRRPGVAPEIRVSAEESRGEWVIILRDNGIGFEPQYAARIFGLFKRLHGADYPGSGLGLAICRRIIDRCGGRIWAEGQPDNGAAFYFTLPLLESR